MDARLFLRRLRGPVLKFRIRNFAAAALCSAIGLTSGCGPSVFTLDESDLAEPAAARARAGDVAEAIRRYNELLTEQPGLARVHLELAFLYDDSGGDYVRAVYHYQRYLELRPRTGKKTMIAELIDAARASLAAAYGYGAAELRQRIDDLERRNAELLAERDDLRRILKEISGTQPPGTAASAPAETASAAPVRRDVRYVVREGDTLSSLAQKFYGDRRQWERIHRANRGRIQDPNVLPVGAAISIPDVPEPAP